MNYCHQCGNKLLPTARFCPACGARLIAAQEADIPTSPKETVKQPSRPVAPKNPKPNRAEERHASSRGLFQRVKGIIISTESEWENVASEEPDTSAIMLRYVLLLALIPAVAILIYTGLIGETVYGFRVRSMSGGIVQGIIQLVSAVLSVYVISFITAWLAPQFYGQRNLGRAMQLIAYSMTPMWLVGFFHVLPSAQTFKIIVMTVGGIYAIYLIFKGLPLIMDVSENKALGYTLAILVAGFVVMAGIGFLLGLGAGLVLGGAGGYGI